MICPHCSHDEAWRNGHQNGCQRWLCRNCGREYLEPASTQAINRPESNFLSATESEKLARRLICAQGDTEKEGELEKCEQTQNSDLLKDFPSGIQAKILEFGVKRENQGYKSAEVTVRVLRELMSKGADLRDPESVKEILKKMPIKENSKALYAIHYGSFLNYLGGNWEKPKYSFTEETPFIPTEEELDQLIAGLGLKTAVFCQIAKETAARRGEIAALKWVDIDFERRVIYINNPEKRSATNAYSVSEKCISMVKQLPRKSERLFSSGKCMSIIFSRQRDKIAYRLNNPRLRQIHLHTFRHWKATMEAYRTRDPFHVQRILRHKSLMNTQRYIHLAEALFDFSKEDAFTVKVAHTEEEAVGLLEVGFTYVGNVCGSEIFKKRK